MNREILEGKWKQVKGKMMDKWHELTDNDLERVHDRWEELEGILLERSGREKERVKEEIREFERNLKDLD